MCYKLKRIALVLGLGDREEERKGFQLELCLARDGKEKETTFPRQKAPLKAGSKLANIDTG